MTYVEPHHLIHRAGWLRAAVMGANDGIVSVASLLMGVAAAGADKPEVLLAGVAGLMAGAMSMAAGEYVSVSSQSDLEDADIARELHELEHNPDAEMRELAFIYEGWGMSKETALKAAEELSKNNPLDAHLRDELGITENAEAQPMQAAVTSAFTFAFGAAFPLVAVILFAHEYALYSVGVSTVLALVILGAFGAKAGGAPFGRAITRVVVWGVLAMALTSGIGYLFGISL